MEVFRFENVEELWLLLGLIPALILFLLHLRWKLKKIKTIGDSKLVRKLMPEFSIPKLILKFALLSLAYTFLVLSLANPQIGSRMEKVKQACR